MDLGGELRKEKLPLQALLKFLSSWVPQLLLQPLGVQSPSVAAHLDVPLPSPLRNA